MPSRRAVSWTLSRLRSWTSACTADRSQILLHVQVWKQQIVLVDHSDAPALGRPARYVNTSDEYRPLSG